MVQNWEKKGENLSRLGERERKWEKIYKSWEKMREMRDSWFKVGRK